MIKQIAKFFCVGPLLIAFAFTQIGMARFSDQAQPNFVLKDKKQNSDLCIKKLKEQQDKIKQEMDLIKKMIKNRHNPQAEDKP